MHRPDNNNPAAFSSRFRRKRFEIIERLLKNIIDKKGSASIIDIGGRRDYWNLLNRDIANNVRITLVNFESELNAGRGSDEDPSFDVSYKQGDGCDLKGFEDRSFDLSHSNSTIEHVGSLQNMNRFAREIQRVGNAYYIQTPYLWFPIDPHYGVPFIHWLPAPTRAALFHRFNIGYINRQTNYLNTLDIVDNTQIVDKTLMTKLFPGGNLTRERFLLMTKSIIITRDPVF